MKETQPFVSRVKDAWGQVSSGRSAFLASVFLLLLVIGAGLFSPFGLSFFDDPGSAADWVAGIGTWAVGYGAIAISIAARRQEVAEKQRKAVEDLRVERSMLLTFMIRGSPIASAVVLGRGVLDTGHSHPKLKLLMLMTAISEAEVPRWDDLDLTILDEKSLAAFYELDLCIRYFKTACRSAIYGLENPDLDVELVPEDSFLREVQELEDALRGFRSAIKIQLGDVEPLTSASDGDEEGQSTDSSSATEADVRPDADSSR
ncbi:hypothetical protein [Stenotrophomonas maltophilia]|uniref:hypothetical protein n=1 Tax=Stenotrophomonas maltophilia TaxID=40324 RepID=UPI0013DC6748|nr:hypothetical protein [Stenotrophomonas maltophilia]